MAVDWLYIAETNSKIPKIQNIGCATFVTLVFNIREYCILFSWWVLEILLGPVAAVASYSTYLIKCYMSVKVTYVMWFFFFLKLCRWVKA
jgi:hypothetical protein